MRQNLQKMKILRPCYCSDKDYWVVAFKYIDDPQCTHWKPLSNHNFYMLDMAKLFITMLVKYTEGRFIAYEYLDLDEFELETTHHSTTPPPHYSIN